MKTFTYEGKKLHFDFCLGTINDVYVKEFGGDFNDLIEIEKYSQNTSKLIDITRDMLLSGHIYYLYINGEDEKAEEMLLKMKSSRMIASKWLEKITILKVLEWIGESFQASEVEEPEIGGSRGKKK